MTKDSAVTKIITDANPGSDYDRVYRSNFDEDFSINPSVNAMMEKLMISHHSTIFTIREVMTKRKIYQSCQVSNKYLSSAYNFIFWANLATVSNY